MPKSKSSSSRIAANIANAKKSTGPKSDAGRRKVSQNAHRHGFAGATLFVPKGMESLLRQIEQDYRDTIRPVGLLEEDLFLQLRNARFNMERAQRLMDDLGHKATRRGQDPLADPELRKDYLIYHRYFAHAQSTVRRTLNELRKLQNERAVRSLWTDEDQPPAPALASAATLLRVARLRMESGRDSVHPPAYDTAHDDANGDVYDSFSPHSGTKPNWPGEPTM